MDQSLSLWRDRDEVHPLGVCQMIWRHYITEPHEVHSSTGPYHDNVHHDCAKQLMIYHRTTLGYLVVHRQGDDFDVHQVCAKQVMIYHRATLGYFVVSSPWWWPWRPQGLYQIADDISSHHVILFHSFIAIVMTLTSPRTVPNGWW